MSNARRRDSRAEARPADAAPPAPPRERAPNAGPMEPPRVSFAIAVRYRLDENLGTRGRATLYRAHDLKAKRDVLLCIMWPEAAEAIGAELFEREMKAAQALHHPNIVPIHDFGSAYASLYYATPPVQGETLTARLRREGKLTVGAALPIIRDVAAALQHAHAQGVAHRDLKPDAILLTDDGAQLTDWGVSVAMWQAGTARMREMGMQMGITQYLSPEQATGEHEVTGRSDIFALGSVAYEMLTGVPAFRGETPELVARQVVTATPPSPSQVDPSLPPNVDAAIRTAISKKPEDRFATAMAFVEALENPLFTSRTTVALRTSTFSTPRQSVAFESGAPVAKPTPTAGAPAVPTAPATSTPTPARPSTAVPTPGSSPLVRAITPARASVANLLRASASFLQRASQAIDTRELEAMGPTFDPSRVTPAAGAPPIGAAPPAAAAAPAPVEPEVLEPLPPVTPPAGMAPVVVEPMRFVEAPVAPRVPTPPPGAAVPPTPRVPTPPAGQAAVTEPRRATPAGGQPAAPAETKRPTPPTTPWKPVAPLAPTPVVPSRIVAPPEVRASLADLPLLEPFGEPPAAAAPPAPAAPPAAPPAAATASSTETTQVRPRVVVPPTAAPVPTPEPVAPVTPPMAAAAEAPVVPPVETARPTPRPSAAVPPVEPTRATPRPGAAVPPVEPARATPRPSAAIPPEPAADPVQTEPLITPRFSASVEQGIHWRSSTPRGSQAIVIPLPRRWPRMLAAAVGLIAVVGVSLAALKARRAPLPPALRVALRVPDTLALVAADLSPDGARVVYATTDDIILTSALGDAAPTVLRANATEPFYSPDAQSVGFTSTENGGRQLRVAQLGGARTEKVIADSAQHGEWGDDGQVYYVRDDGAIARVAPAGGASEVLLAPNDSVGRVVKLVKVPGAPTLLFSYYRGDGEVGAVGALDLAKKRWARLVRGAEGVAFAAPNWLIFGRGRAVMAAPLTNNALSVDEEPRQVFAVETDGLQFLQLRGPTLLFQPLGAEPSADPVIRLADGRERALANLPPSVALSYPRISPDGKVVAFTGKRAGASEHDVWIYEMPGGPLRALASLGNEHPRAFTPDGSQVLISSDRNGRAALYLRPWKGWGEPTKGVLALDQDDLLAASLLPDGAHVVFGLLRGDTHAGDLGIAPFGRPDSIVMLTAGPFHEWSPSVSPDGRWLAYRTNESGRSEVVVRPIDGGRAVQVSRAGGYLPQWARDGRALFYESEMGDTLYQASLDLARGARVTGIKPVAPIVAGRGFDVFPGDGEILTFRPRGEAKPPAPPAAVVNFRTEVEKAFGR
jgi:serine/threonine protein kinase